MKITPFAIAAFLQIISAETEVESVGRPLEFETDNDGGSSTRQLIRKRNATPLHQSRHSDEEYDPFLGLVDDDDDEYEYEYEDMRELQEEELSMPQPALPTLCSFCPDGIPDPDVALPTDDGTTCGAAGDFASTLDGDHSLCPTIQLAQTFCCAEVPVATGKDDAPVVEEELEAETCAFCPEGLTVPEDTVTPGDSSCGAAMGFAASLQASDAMCATVQMAEMMCCPPVEDVITTEAPVQLPEVTDPPVVPQETTEAPPAATATTTEAPVQLPETTDVPVQLPETTEVPPATEAPPAEEDDGCSKSAKGSKSVKSSSGSKSEKSKSTKKCPSAKSSKSAVVDAKAEKVDSVAFDAKAEKMKGDKKSKTLKVPMAKVAKDNKGPGAKGSDDAKSKSSKTLNADAKAEKKASSNDDLSQSKSGKEVEPAGTKFLRA